MFFRTLLVSAFLLAAAAGAFAQDSSSVPKSPWKISVLTNLTLTLNTYSDNWTGGEFGAMSWAWTFNGTAERPFTSWISNKNTLKLAFGQTAIEQTDSLDKKSWDSPKKSSDLIDFESVLRFTLKSFADPFASVRAVSQFADMRTPGTNYYGNPVELTESVGALRDFVKRDRVTWSGRLGAAVRQKMDRSLPDSADEMTNDGGAEFVMDFKAASKDNRLSFVSQAKAYQALFSSIADALEGTPMENDWRYTDVTWDNTLGITLTKYMMLNLYAQLLYDREIDADVRYKETVGLALTYSFAN